jgi:hypothetical protein
VSFTETGQYTGLITIPEAITLIFRAENPETLYGTLEPTLRTDPLTRTALITLSQGTTKREIALSAN